ncbi:carbamoyltransferase HypF [Candidatus Bipolaricaulota bacterium]|nr:carbamoyltransferase HypF [Candidatus Bipolaricaulota bacterium]
MADRVRQRIHVVGTVQGVGFRPFVYRTAVGQGLAGHVRNLGDAGVEIEVEGDPASLARFITALRHEAPPLAEIEDLELTELSPNGDREFRIAPSLGGGGGRGTIPPDVATCAACLADIAAPESRYRGYWATSCTDCGPRFTVIEGLPYDRPRTAFREFPMCPDCQREYTDPLNRRYHAQTIACPRCGPRLRYVEAGHEAIEDPIARVAVALCAGKVVAIKGLGGTHLACDATREEVVAELRRRLGRPGQPFALMAREDQVERFARPNPEEWALLRSPRRPIVVLPLKPGTLAPSVAPGLDTVGVMLPYTGLHHLLLERSPFPLVMTSANYPGRPMLIDDARILGELSNVADSFLLHNRRIVARCDDSVLRLTGGAPTFLRRSRGWVPEPIAVDLGEDPLLALGGDLNVTLAVYRQGKAYLSQHIGNTEHLDTLEFLRRALDHLLHLAGIPLPTRIACDLHPRFATTRLAQELGEAIPMQHHVAHVAGLAGEHGVEELVGIAVDGYGYGTDGEAWGGEVIVWKGGEWERVGSLAPVPMPGGDLATLRPGRMAASYLLAAGLDPAASGLRPEETEAVRIQIERGVNCPRTTSAGRFLDAVAAWLGICRERTYEGEPAMRLEAAAAGGTAAELPLLLRERDGRRILDTVDLFRALDALRAEGTSTGDLAATAQDALARGLARIAVEAAQERGIAAVGLTGGVAVNDAIATATRSVVEKAGLRFLAHRLVPPGDGGLAFGQLVHAACQG